jgi:hypothetical protein
MYDYLSILIFLAVEWFLLLLFSAELLISRGSEKHPTMNVVLIHLMHVAGLTYILFSCFTILSYGFRNFVFVFHTV